MKVAILAHSRATFALTIVLLLGIALLPARFTTTEASAQEDVTAAARNLSLYLPITLRNYPPPPSVFGGALANSNLAEQASAAGVTWARYHDIKWSKVEPTRGARQWGAIAADEQELKALSANGLTPIAVVLSTPSWAQKVAGVSCGPIQQEDFGAFAAFMADLVTRLSAPPYNVHYYEIWNEPDAPIVAPDNPWGCWGDRNDPYYGGGYYAEMLKVVYPAIKQANPHAKVLLGGLLLDCDPTNPPEGKDCKISNFLEGILRNGGGNFFDIMSYHGYPIWGSVQLDWDLGFPSWAHRGGVVLGKLDFIRSVMGKYGVNKPIMLTEGGLLCYKAGACKTNGSMDRFRADQANYVVRLYTRALANGLTGVLWYTFDEAGWRDSGLIKGSEIYPGYNAMKFLSKRLAYSQLVSKKVEGSLERYTFRKDGTHYHVYWSNSSTKVPISLPAGARVYNMLGVEIPRPATVGFEPIIVESSR